MVLLHEGTLTLRDQILQKTEAKEAEDVVLGLYASGCTVQQISEAFRTTSDMVTFRVSEVILNDAIQQRVSVLEGRSVPRLSGKDLAKDYVSSVVVPALTPQRWWEDQPDSAKKGLVTLAAVGVRTEPPCLVLEYFRSSAPGAEAKKRHRYVYLHEALSPTGPTIQLAKKLASTHGALITEADLQKNLMKLQKLLKEGATLSTAPTAAVSSTVTTSSSSAATTASSASTKGPNKADLGLLYRDPEAALKNVDLQDADDLTVKEFKNKMSEVFEVNAVKPGDPGYKYDSRKTFRATKKSEWDDDEDDDDDDF
ncbi:Hypothetical protein, putative [Bodo saltans]|uniref:Centrosomal protein of 19 kDa n=1 Tax=Bodo saltans TaxID=75058 RepID=A0A0S4JKX9_BODSA|nr:Hypothetical protein, putative [Bodo saltans]|eukprot:CUG92189.1 Hypothetical protein, putative [Bodo saltans]